MPQRKRCTYEERGRRCTKGGSGDPQLCRAHHELLEDEGEPRSAFASVLGKFVSGKRVSRDDLADVISEAVGGRSARQVVEDFARQAGTDPSHFVRQQAEQARRVMEQAQARARAARGTPPPRQAPRQAPRSPQDDAIYRARVTLGFSGQYLLLDRQTIKDRQRELAKKFHPDRKGGSTAKMQEINQAVDILLKSVDN